MTKYIFTERDIRVYIEYRTRYFIEKDRGQDLYFIEKERRKINKYRKGQDIPYVKEKGRGQNILYNERQRTRYVQWFILTEKEQKNESFYMKET